MVAAKTIVIQPLADFGYRELQAVADHLGEKLERYGFDIILSPTRLQPPLQTFDWRRRQYKSWLFLEWLSKIYSDINCLVIGIADVDAYVPGLNFVFGQADPTRGVAAVYTRRLKTLNHETSKFLSRLKKETLHELGHLLGLHHCANRECVMSFSNSLDEVDEKGDDFCNQCKKHLERLHGLNLK